jgi:hypothetical protein
VGPVVLTAEDESGKAQELGCLVSEVLDLACRMVVAIDRSEPVSREHRKRHQEQSSEVF